ncbi:MAG: hypothetical protein MJE68_06750 [Proteobacteria bacterium]|nr:hypothetical protein [Pseudomonadota bacterium]
MRGIVAGAWGRRRHRGRRGTATETQSFFPILLYHFAFTPKPTLPAILHGMAYIGKCQGEYQRRVLGANGL